MKIKVITDTRVKGVYTRSGATLDVSDTEGKRLIALGWAIKVPDKKTEKRK